MKFVHIADMHFDSPFAALGNIDNLGDVRRIEQRNVFRKIIDFIKQNEVDYFFISGDLYEHEYIRKSTIEYINRCFAEIMNTQIFITPGNHDPYIKNSYYEKFNWNANVHICKSEIEVVCEQNEDFYMTAFTDFYQNESPIENMRIQNPHKTNILITHCDLNGVRDKNRFFL